MTPTMMTGRMTTSRILTGTGKPRSCLKLLKEITSPGTSSLTSLIRLPTLSSLSTKSKEFFHQRVGEGKPYFVFYLNLMSMSSFVQVKMPFKY